MGFRPMFLLDAGEAKQLIPLKMLYVVQNYCYSLIAYLPIFFEEANFTKSEIGLLLAIPCLCTIFGPPFWGAIADALHRHKHVHVFCHVTSAVLIFSIQFIESFPLMCAVVFIAYFHMVPSIALLDVAALKLMEPLGADFGKQRAYACVGYCLGGLVTGFLASSVGIKTCFSMMLGVSCVALVLLVVYIPAGYGHDATAGGGEATASGDEQAESPTPIEKPKSQLRDHLIVLARRLDVLLLFAVALAAGVSGGFIDSFLFLNVYDLSNDGASIVSVFIAVQTMSEVPVFFFSTALAKRFGTPLCLVSVAACFFVRDLIYAYMKQPWYVVPVEALHGITFGLLVASLTTYLYAAAPKGATATAVGLLSAFQRGIGAGLAALAGGYIYDDYGVHTLWKIGAFGVVPVTLLLIGVFACLARRYASTKPNNLEAQFIERSQVEKIDQD